MEASNGSWKCRILVLRLLSVHQCRSFHCIYCLYASGWSDEKISGQETDEVSLAARIAHRCPVVRGKHGSAVFLGSHAICRSLLPRLWRGSWGELALGNLCLQRSNNFSQPHMHHACFPRCSHRCWFGGSLEMKLEGSQNVSCRLVDVTCRFRAQCWHTALQLRPSVWHELINSFHWRSQPRSGHTHTHTHAHCTVPYWTYWTTNIRTSWGTRLCIRQRGPKQ